MSEHIKPAGSCKHRPISNGWSCHLDLKSGDWSAESWCGYCRSFVEIDSEWIEKFHAHGRSAPVDVFGGAA